MNGIFNKLLQINNFIITRSTGTPSQLAIKLNVSERSLYEYLKLMKQMGAPIRYNRSRSSYYYVRDGEFFIGFIKGEL